MLWMKYFRDKLINSLQTRFGFDFSRQLMGVSDKLKRFLSYGARLQALWGRAIFIIFSLLFYLDKAIKNLSYFLGPFLSGSAIDPPASQASGELPPVTQPVGSFGESPGALGGKGLPLSNLTSLLAPFICCPGPFSLCCSFRSLMPLSKYFA